MSAATRKGVDLAHVAETLRQWEGREVFVRAVSDSGCEAWVDEIVPGIRYWEDAEAEETDFGVYEADWCLIFHLDSSLKFYGWLKRTAIAKVERTTITLGFDGEATLTIALLAQA